MAQSLLVIEDHEETAAKLTTMVQKNADNPHAFLSEFINWLMRMQMGLEHCSLRLEVGGAQAATTVSCDEVVADNTFVLGEVTLTGKVSPSGENQFAIGSDDDDAATNLAAAINAHSVLSQMVSAAVATAEVSEVTTITCVADSSDNLDGTYFLIQDEAGSVGVWIDTDDSGTTIPTGANNADRAIEVTGIATDAIASAVATAVASAINADSKFTASADGANVTVTCVEPAALTDAADGDTGFGFAVATQGVDATVTVTSKIPGAEGEFGVSGTGGISASPATMTGGTEGTNVEYSF